MIIMVNGAFGVGKTTVAELLQKEFENSMIYDPEEVGYMLRAILPLDNKKNESPTGDFQDFQLWPELVVEMARHLKQTYQKDLIVPMTLRNVAYFQMIFNGLKECDVETYHFCLTASKEIIYNRLRARGEEEGNWCFHQTDACLEAYKQPDFETYIDTTDRTPMEVVKVIRTSIMNDIELENYK